MFSAMPKPRFLARATAVLAAVVACGAAAAPAQAAPAEANLGYGCTWPLIETLPMKLQVVGDPPPTVGAPQTWDPWNVELQAEFDQNTYDGMKLIQAASLEGSATITFGLLMAGGFALEVEAKITLDKFTLPATRGPFTLSGAGAVPPVPFPPAAADGSAYDLTVDGMAFSLLARKADGSIRRLPEWDDEEDGNRDTFSVSCDLSPAGQDTTLSDGGPIDPPDPAPTQPGAPVVSVRETSSAKLCWAAPTRGNVVAYELYEGYRKIETTGVCATVRDLTPGPHWYHVVARDVWGQLSPPSEVTKFSTRDAPPPATINRSADVSCQFPLIGALPLSVDAGVGLGERIPTTRDGSFPVALTFTDEGAFRDGYRTLGLASVEGYAVVTGTVEDPLGGTSAFEVTLPIDRAGLAETGPSSFQALGETPPQTIFGPGEVTLTIATVRLNLTFRDAEGLIKALPPVGEDSDGNPNSADAACGLAPSSPVVFEASAEVYVPVEPIPTQPGKPVIVEVTQSSVKICWSASTITDGDTILEYGITIRGLGVRYSSDTCTELASFPPSTTYEITVRAITVKGTRSVSSEPVSFTTLPVPPVKYGYGVSGAAQLKNLTRGSVPLSGSVDAELTLATGDFTADLSLQRSTANLVALGFLPVVAKVDVVPTAAVTGNLAGGVLTASTKVRIKLPQVTLFGLQLAGGSNCQTRSASAINLKSVGEFDALDGGTLAGTFSISDLTGCGVLTGLVSPLTAGPGNTIALKLAPPA